MSIPTPNYMLIDDCSIYSGLGKDPIMLPAGSFVRPIDDRYVPKHVLEDERFKHYQKNDQVFVYTKFGIVPVKRESVRPA